MCEKQTKLTKTFLAISTVTKFFNSTILKHNCRHCSKHNSLTNERKARQLKDNCSRYNKRKFNNDACCHMWKGDL